MLRHPAQTKAETVSYRSLHSKRGDRKTVGLHVRTVCSRRLCPAIACKSVYNST